MYSRSRFLQITWKIGIVKAARKGMDGEEMMRILADDILHLESLAEKEKNEIEEKLELVDVVLHVENLQAQAAPVPTPAEISEMVDENSGPSTSFERFKSVELDDTVKFVDDNKAKNTKYKTKSDMKIFSDWACSIGETRPVETIPPEELDNILAKFYMAVRKRDGTEYEPDSVSAIQNSIDRYLKDHVQFSIKRDSMFSHSNRVLESKRKFLKAQGMGNKSHQAEPLTRQEIEQLRSKGLLGCETPKQLLYTVWLNNGIFFGLRGRQDHLNLMWGDIALKRTTDGREYLEFNERRTKTRSGAKSSDIRKLKPKAFERPDDSCCPVKVFKAYRDHRPANYMGPDTRFYLQNIKSPNSDVWFSATPVGKDKLGKMMNTLAEEGELEGRKVNHSCRKTFATTLVQAGRPSTEIAHLAGWKNVQTVNEYSAPSMEQQEEASDIIADVVLANPSPKDKETNMTTVYSEQKENQLNYSNRQNLNPYAVLCGANISGGSVNINVYSGKRKRVDYGQNSQESD